MLTRQAVGVGTAFYDGDSAVQSEVQVADEGEDEDHHDDAVSCSNDGILFSLEESHSNDSNGGCLYCSFMTARQLVVVSIKITSLKLLR